MVMVDQVELEEEAKGVLLVQTKEHQALPILEAVEVLHIAHQKMVDLVM
jgi:hypothetical protein